MRGGKHPLFGVARIAHLVDQVVIDVHHLVLSHQGAGLLFAHGQYILGQHHCRGWYRLRQDARAVVRALGADAIGQHIATAVFGQLQALVRQQRRHAQLGVAGQTGQHGGQLCVKAVFLANQALQLFSHLIAQRV